MRPFNFHPACREAGAEQGRHVNCVHYKYPLAEALLYLNCIQTISHDDTLHSTIFDSILFGSEKLFYDT